MTDHEDHREEAVETMDEGTAVLSNIGGFTTFTYGDTSIFFRAPYSLLRYIAVKEWDRGRIVADAMYFHSSEQN